MTVSHWQVSPTDPWHPAPSLTCTHAPACSPGEVHQLFSSDYGLDLQQPADIRAQALLDVHGFMLLTLPFPMPIQSKSTLPAPGSASPSSSAEDHPCLGVQNPPSVASKVKVSVPSLPISCSSQSRKQPCTPAQGPGSPPTSIPLLGHGKNSQGAGPKVLGGKEGKQAEVGQIRLQSSYGNGTA